MLVGLSHMHCHCLVGTLISGLEVNGEAVLRVARHREREREREREGEGERNNNNKHFLANHFKLDTLTDYYLNI